MICLLAARLEVSISLYSTSAEYSALDPSSPILRINTKSALKDETASHVLLISVTLSVRDWISYCPSRPVLSRASQFISNLQRISSTARLAASIAPAR